MCPKAKLDKNFWETKSLGEMTQSEWESLCDGCGRCCLNKVEFEDTEEIVFTRAACFLLDEHSCKCSNYKQRKSLVPDCIKLTPKRVERMDYLPTTCAYRRLAEGKGLLSWHPLISGDSESVHRAGVSVRGKTIDERLVDDLEDQLIHWIEV